MFALFYSLYLAMLNGFWIQYDNTDIINYLKNPTNGLGSFLTNIFGDCSFSTLGDSLFETITIAGKSFPTYYAVIAFVLATITSIGIVVMAVKGVKKAFGIFFMGFR